MTCSLCRIDIGKGTYAQLQVQGNPCFSCSKLEKLNRDVDDLKGAVDRATELRRAYFEEMNQKCDPMRHLPIELISSIFVYCLPRPHSLDIFQDVPLNDQVGYADRPVQYLLGSICRHWRQVAWSTPQLWNILWLHFTIDMTAASNQRVAEWLSRSGRLPLYVRMFWDPDGICKPQVVTRAWGFIKIIINNLSRYSDRFRVLDLSLVEEHILYFRRHGSAPANSILERLDIKLDKDPPRFGLVPPRWKFQLAQKPSPTRVSLQDIGIDVIHIHWSNVTQLEGINFSERKALTALMLAPQLQHFKVKIVIFDKPPFPTVTHNSLKTLQIVWDTDQHFLNNITCPALEKFSFDTEYCPILLPVEYFLRRSKCPLKELVLDGVEEEEADLESLLQLTPLLTHLSLLKCFTPRLEEHLANIRRNAVKGNQSLPFLRSFQLTTQLRSAAPLLSIISDLVAPDDVPKPGSSIKVVFFTDHDYEPPSLDYPILSRISGLVEGGVEFEVKDDAGLDLICLSRESNYDI